MDEKRLRDQLEGLFSDVKELSLEVAEDVRGPVPAPPETAFDDEGEPSIGVLTTRPDPGGPVDSALPQPLDAPEPSFVATPEEAYAPKGLNVRWIAWAVLGTLAVIMLVAYSQSKFFSPSQPAATEDQARFAISPSPSPPPTLTAVPTARRGAFAILEPTAAPTRVPGGQTLVLTPEEGNAGWVASDDESVVAGFGPQNHFGDSFLYAGVLNGKIHHGAIRFDLAEIPRGTEIHAASLRLTGLRSDKLNEGAEGVWRLQLLEPEIDYYWQSHNYQQIHRADALTTLEPALSAADLGDGRINQIELTPEQLALLERRLIEGGDETGKYVSFRLDGPAEGDDNLFVWDSGQGEFSQGDAPELFLSLGPPPEATPPPYAVLVTSTPTPRNVLTAQAISQRMTAEATRVGTATPLPPNWVTPVVVTATPTAANEATAEVMGRQATAVAMTTGEPVNMSVVVATATPTFVVITSTPTPQTVETAQAISWWLTAEAERSGPATPLPSNWVTPVVVTSTPTPENKATVAYWSAVAQTTGTPTPLPANAVTATSTPAFALLEGELPAWASTPTPTGTPQFLPSELVGKIAFLSDRAYHTNAATEWVEGEEALPLGEPLVYVMDPDGSNLALLSDRWPYDLAVQRDAMSADMRYRVFVRDNVPWGGGKPTLFSLDLHNNWEDQITYFGSGMAYDPSWSPTSERIVFVSDDSGNDEIWVINRDGSDPLQLTRNSWEWDKHPSWSPDGSQIVFWSNRTGNRGIWVMDPDGSNLRNLSRTGFNDWDPVWIKYTDPVR